MMQVYFVRHGQSLANALGQHAGWAQVPLTEQGRQDAQKAGEVLAGITPDAVYSSDLLRALETAAIALPGCRPVATPLLRELHVGELAGKCAAQCREQYGTAYDRAREALDFTPFGGESAGQHVARAAAFLKELEQTGDRTAVAFCHEGTLRSLYNYVNGLPAGQRVPCKNGGVCRFAWDGTAWTVEAWEL